MNDNDNMHKFYISWGWLLALLFIGLKLTGFIDWSWWWVLSPIWIIMAFGVAMLLLAALIGVFLKDKS